jgi:DNA-binding CsgD family transcriptional regulator
MTMAIVAVAALARHAERTMGASASNGRHWLSIREQEVLDQLITGRSIKEIAHTLSRSPHTVHDHVKALHRKLGARTRGELIARALGFLPHARDDRHAGRHSDAASRRARHAGDAIPRSA